MFGNLGNYPPEYNKKIHGPYDPARYYGKADTPLAEVKLGELSAWFTRRSFLPLSMVQAISRAYWRWNHKYMLPKKNGVAPLIHICLGSVLLFYTMNYGKIKQHRNVKHHW